MVRLLLCSLLCLLLGVVGGGLGSASMVGQARLPDHDVSFPGASVAPQLYGIANFFTNTPGPRSVLRTVAIDQASGEITPVMDNMITLDAKDSIPSDFLAVLDKQHGIYSWSDSPYTTFYSSDLACKAVQTPLDVIRFFGELSVYRIRFLKFVQDDVFNRLYTVGTCQAGQSSLCIGERLPDRYRPVLDLPDKYDPLSAVGAALDVATNRFFLIAKMAKTDNHAIVTVSLTSSSVLSDVTIADACSVAPYYSWYDPATRILFGVAAFANNVTDFWILRIDPTTGGCTKTRMNIPKAVGSVVTSSWTFDNSSNQLWFSAGSTAAGNFLLTFDIRRGAISNMIPMKGLQTPLLNVAVGPASWKCGSVQGELDPSTNTAPQASMYGMSFNGPFDALAPKVYSIESGSGAMSLVSPNGIFQTDIVHMRVGNSAFDQKGGRFFSVPFGSIKTIFTTDVKKKLLLTPMRYADARADRMVFNNVNNQLYSLYITSTGELFIGVIGATDFRPALQIPTEYNGVTASKCLGIDESKGILFLAITKGEDPRYYILSISIKNWQIIKTQQLDASSCDERLVPFYLYYDTKRADLIMGTTNLGTNTYVPTVLRIDPLTGRCSDETRITFPGGGRSVYAYSYDNTTNTLWFASNGDSLYSLDMNSRQLEWVSFQCPGCRNFLGTASLEVSHFH